MNIVPQNLSVLVDQWLEQESNGVRFPVDFDVAWKIAGYSSKQKAKNKLKYLVEDEDFLTDRLKTPKGGRPSHLIKLTCDAFKHFCLLAETKEGQQIRQYFIESEKKWKLVKQHHPDVANDIEVMKLKIELAKLERDKAALENRTIELRYTITQTCPEPVQQKILGYQVVEKVEYRDRIIKNDDLIRDGSTINKTELCRRYGILTRNGKPDYKALNHILNHADLPSDAFILTASIMENREFNRDYLGELDAFMVQRDRQMYLGE